MGIQERAGGVYALAQGLSDRVISRDTREQFYANINSFANEQPFLASFLFIQLVLSFTPVAVFGSFVVGTVLFAVVAALLFSLFWIGGALVVLVPALVVTVSLGVAVWIWAVGSFLLARWAYSWIPLGVRGGNGGGGGGVLEVPNGETGGGGDRIGGGAGYGDGGPKVRPQVPAKTFVLAPETVDVKEY